MPHFVSVQGLRVDPALFAFVEQEALPGSGLEPRDFWRGLARMARDFGPRRLRLLERRAELQAQIDAWSRVKGEEPFDSSVYGEFLTSIGYVEPEEPHFEISPPRIDREFSKVAAPQMVTPMNNARYVLRGLGSRWGGLIRALYFTDAVSPTPAPTSAALDQERLERARLWALEFLDQAAPLQGARHAQAVSYRLGLEEALIARLADGSETGLVDPEKLLGWRGAPEAPEVLLLRNNNLHIELVFDRQEPAAVPHPARLLEVVLEAGATILLDLEDLMTSADAEDKLTAYRNWLALCRGELETSFVKNGALQTRVMAPDRTYEAVGGGFLRLKGRAVALARLIGLAPTTPAVRTPSGGDLPEFMLDAMICALCGLHDLAPGRVSRNSDAGSIYLGLPKLQSPEECALAEEILGRVEDCLRLPRLTLKAALMVEERRLSLNLKACLRPLKRRIAFLGAGLLDGAGAEARAYAEAGPLPPLAELRTEAWIGAYERHAVDMAVETNFTGRAKLGRGAWARPHRMADLLAEPLLAEGEGGAATSVDAFSPTAATLLATHYHRFDPRARQTALGVAGRRAEFKDLLHSPVVLRPEWPEDLRRAETEDNAFALLNYAARWILYGEGFALIRGGPLYQEAFEDCALARLTSQHLANWLRHGVISEADLTAAFAGAEIRLAPGLRGPSAPLEAAMEMIRKAGGDPSGYVHEILRRRRLEVKAAARRPEAKAG